MVKKIIKIPIFDRIIEIIWDDSLEKIDKYVKDCCFEDWFSSMTEVRDARTWITTNGYIYVGLSSKNKSTMVHELGHVVFGITKMLGIEDEETFCYLLEYIYKEITDD